MRFGTAVTEYLHLRGSPGKKAFYILNSYGFLLGSLAASYFLFFPFFPIFLILCGELNEKLEADIGVRVITRKLNVTCGLDGAKTDS